MNHQYSTRVIIIILIILLASQLIHAQSLEVTLTAGDYSIQKSSDDYHKIIMDDFGTAGNEPGKPNLPGRIFLIALPPGAKASSVNIDGKRQLVEDSYRIEPSPINQVFGNKNIPDLKGQQIWESNYQSAYSSDQFFPVQIAYQIGSGSLRNIPYVAVLYQPFAYQASTGKLSISPEINLTVKYEIEFYPGMNSSIPANFWDIAEDLFINFDQIEYLYQKAKSQQSGSTEYLIIIPQKTTSILDAIDPLVKWKIELGYALKIVDFSETGSNAQDIRKYLRNNYLLKGIVYVLLIGRYMDIPFMDAYPKYPQEKDWPIPTDFYYAELTFQDFLSWDYDGDGHYGEFKDDKVDLNGLADVFVGRIPIHPVQQNTLLKEFCTKIVAVEKEAGNWKDNALLIGALAYGDNNQLMWNTFEQMELIKTNFPHINCTTVYENEDIIYKPPTHDVDLTRENVRTNWKNNQNGMIVWTSHGVAKGVDNWPVNGAIRNYWEAGKPTFTKKTFIETNDANQLQNTNPVIFAVSCNTGRPEGCFVHDLFQNKAAVAAMAATRKCYSPIPWMAYDFISMLDPGSFLEKPYGDAFYATKVKYWVYNGGIDDITDYANVLMYTFYGDPSLNRKRQDMAKATKLACSANPISIFANGSSISTLTVEILDQYGNLVPTATNEITFAITLGSASGQLVGTNPVKVVSGVATIQLQSTTTPGQVIIEASSPDLISSSTNVHVYSSTNPTIVGGEIKTNTTWTAANSPYLAISDIFIHRGGTLTIEPGVTVLFNSGTGLRVADQKASIDEGSLNAQGTDTNPIIFTSASGNTGDWKGIFFDADSDYGVSSTLSYCIVEKAGQPNARNMNANIACYYTHTPAISNCTISNSSGYGIYFYASSPSISNSTITNSSTDYIVYLYGSSSTINDNIITGNGSSYWIFCATNGTNPTINNNIFTGNVTNALRLGTSFQMNGNNLSGAADMSIEVWGGDMNHTRNWHQQTGSTTYKIVGSDIFIHNGGSLIIDPGITVLFNSGTGLRVADYKPSIDEGSLIAQGTSNNPIIFTNASGNVGDWKGILFDGDSDYGVSSIFNYCIVEKAGQANAHGINANIYYYRTNSPSISNCTIRNSSGYGMYLYASSPSISNSIIDNNTASEVIYLYESSPTITNNTINGNGNPYWIQCVTTGSNPVLTNNTFIGNVTRALRLGTNFRMSGNSLSGAGDLSIEVLGGELVGTRTWTKQIGTATYKIVSNDIFVHKNGVLTIDPGITMKFSSGTGLVVAGDTYSRDRGTVIANGDPSDPITFTSASGNVGDWRGILFDDDSDDNVTSVMNYCIVEKAGQNNARGGNSGIYYRLTNKPTLSNCFIQNNGADGLDLVYSSPTLTKCKILNNGNHGIYCGTLSHPTIGNVEGATNDIFGNSMYDIYVAGSDNINARHNYWGTTNENQIKSVIYDKYDNPNSGEVFYSPWATESGGANHPPTSFSLLLPLNYAVIKTLLPTFKWQKSYDIDGSTDPIYTLQVSTDSTFTSSFLEFSDITGETYTISQPLQDITKYFWRVKATDEENAFTWSNEIWSFTINTSAENHPPFAPSVILPINGEEAKPGDYLVWTKSIDPDIGDVVTYTIELDNNSDFSSPEIHQSGISGEKTGEDIAKINKKFSQQIQNSNAVYIRIISLHDYVNLQDDTTYFWRVKTVDNYGTKSDFTSSTSHFFFNKTNTVPEPVIAGFSPKDGIEVRTNTPEISWHPAIDTDLSDHAGALHYYLQLDDDGEFVNNYQFQYTTASGLNTFEVTDQLTENQKWYYRIQTIDDEGAASSWSAIQNFWVNAIDEPPNPFALHQPGNNSTVTGDSIHFEWANSFDVDPHDQFCFSLQYSTDNTFATNVIEIKDLMDTTITIETTNFSQVLYFWRVKAIDSDGLVTWGSNSGETAWSFNFNPTCVSDGDIINIPKEFALSQNHPNPQSRNHNRISTSPTMSC